MNTTQPYGACIPHEHHMQDTGIGYRAGSIHAQRTPDSN